MQRVAIHVGVTISDRWIFLLVLLVIPIASEPLFAQSSLRKHRFGFGVGVSSEVNRDDLASPLRYTGALFPVRVGYQFKGSRNQHQISVGYGQARLKSNITQGNVHTQQSTFLEAQGVYRRSIGTMGQGTYRLFLGLGADSYYSFREHRYTSTIVEYTGIYYVGISPSFVIQRTLSPRDDLTLELASPIAAYVLRPPYSLKGPWESRFTFARRFTAATAGITYERDLSLQFSLRVNYQYRYYWTEWPFVTEAAQNSLNVALVYKR